MENETKRKGCEMVMGSGRRSSKHARVWAGRIAALCGRKGGRMPGRPYRVPSISRARRHAPSLGLAGQERRVVQGKKGKYSRQAHVRQMGNDGALAHLLCQMKTARKERTK